MYQGLHYQRDVVCTEVYPVKDVVCTKVYTARETSYVPRFAL